MIYQEFTNELSKLTGIEESIFNINLDDEELVKEDYFLKEYRYHEYHGYYLSAYKYKQNLTENWECVTLYIRSIRVKEFLDTLNLILKKFNYAEINTSGNHNNFEITNNGILLLVGIYDKNDLKLDIARIKA